MEQVIGEHLHERKFLTFQRFQRTDLPIVIDDYGIYSHSVALYQDFKFDQGIMIDGQKEGLWVNFDMDDLNEVFSTGTYHHGKEEGFWVFWRYDGQIEAEGQYVGGKKNGFWILWSEDGRMSARGQFVDGREEGIWEFWDENGLNHTQVEFRNEKLI